MTRFALTVVLALVVPALAQDSPGPATQPQASTPTTAPAGEPVPADAIPLGQVRTVDGLFTKARLIRLTVTGQAKDPGEMSFHDGRQRVILPADGVVRVESASAEPDRTVADRMPDNATALLLVNGEWVVGLISGGDERQVRVSVIGCGELALPLRQVRGVVAPAGRVGQNLAQLERAMLAERPAGEPQVENDTLKLANGETVTGTVTAIDPKGLTVQGPLGKLTVALDVLTVALLANPLAPVRAPDAPVSAWVELANGSRLLATRLTWEAHTIRVTRPGQKDPILLPDMHVAAVEVVNGRWRWLDDLAPLLAEHRPFLSVRWPVRFGANVLGGPVKIADRTYSHGIGVHSASRLIFAADKARRFHCLAGLDAVAGPFADVDIQVLLDGQVRFEKKSIKAADGPVAIDLDTSGGQKLELRVDFGANGDVQDRFNWADPALIR